MVSLSCVMSVSCASPLPSMQPNTDRRGSRPYAVSTIRACSLSARMTAFSTGSCCASMVSILLRTQMSAASICSTSRSTTGRWIPLCLIDKASKNRIGSWNAHAGALCISSDVPYASRNALESTTVTIVSRAVSSKMFDPASSISWNCSRTALGSAMPDISMTMWSHWVPRRVPSRRIAMTASRNSSVAVQQAHPFCSSIMSPAYCCKGSPELPSSKLPSSVCSRSSLASMLTDAMSLTITPIRRPSLFSRMFLSSVVLPAPRKPLRIVIGTRLAFVASSTGRSAGLARRPSRTAG
mmetsp:Transcript_7363/g.17962  ORF Transcript_7363/g.17962 Transcript_7363/m.17962 type:complete len:296 (+) Transcript_7363:1035-1922(+)